MFWTLKILIFQHCFCLDIIVILGNCCQKEQAIRDYGKACCFGQARKKKSDSGDVFPGICIWDRIYEDGLCCRLVPCVLVVPVGDVEGPVGPWETHTLSKCPSCHGSCSWCSGSRRLPGFAPKAPVCMNGAIMTRRKPTLEAPFQHVTRAQSSI